MAAKKNRGHRDQQTPQSDRKKEKTNRVTMPDVEWVGFDFLGLTSSSAEITLSKSPYPAPPGVNRKLLLWIPSDKIVLKIRFTWLSGARAGVSVGGIANELGDEIGAEYVTQADPVNEVWTRKASGSLLPLSLQSMDAASPVTIRYELLDFKKP